MSADELSPFARLGGEAFVRPLVEKFIQRVTTDIMIGFFFSKVDRPRLVQLEFELARQHLGGEGSYSGRPLQLAHGRHRIFEGHFNRRLVILKEVLSEFEVPLDIQSTWLDHDRALRSIISS